MKDDTKPPPEYGRIPAAVEQFGLSRAGLYRLAAEGRIRLVKAGRTTLADFGSIRGHMATLPEARIGGSK